MKTRISAFLLLLSSFNSFSQIKFDRYSLEHGLSQSVVLDIVQDQNGFLWFATQEGLNRFDGYKFKIFKQKSDDSTSLSDNWINSIVLDDHFLWLGTESGGISKMDLITNKVERYSAEKSNLKKIQSNIIRQLIKDKSGNLWIATWGGGLSRKKTNSQTFETFLTNKENTTSISDNWVRTVYEDSTGIIWAGTKDGLNKFNSETSSFDRIYHTDNSNSLTENFITCIFSDSKNRMWVGTREGLNLSFDSGKTFKRIIPESNKSHSINDKIILTVAEDHLGTIWVGTYSGGLNKLENQPEEKNPECKFSSYSNQQENINSISGNYIRKIFEDKSGLLWIGTWGSGITKINLKPYKFKKVTVSENGLSQKFARTFSEDHYGNLWVGTQGGGVNIIDKITGIYSYLNKSGKVKLPDDDVYAFAEDKNGMMWIGTNSGLSKYDSAKKRFDNYRAKSKNEFELSEVVRSIATDKEGNIWIGTRSGLIFYDADSELFSPVIIKNKNENISFVYVSNKNDLWVSVRDGGVYKVSLKNRKEIENFKEYKFLSGKRNSISSNNVLCMLEDSRGMILFGTSNGLNQFDPNLEMFSLFDQDDGLPNNVIYGIVEGNNNDLWISTNYGLSRYNENLKDNWGKHFRNYDVEDGLQSNEFNTGACFKSKEGEIFFGGINGFNRFFPDEVSDNQFTPSIVFSDLRILDQTVPHSVYSNKPIEMKYDDKVFSFEMSSLDFTNPNKNQYAYQLQGFDDQWNFSGTRRFANYTNLDPGNYTLKIIGSNNDGIWNNTGTSLSLIITPPFWMTWWFRILIVLFIVVIPVLIYVNRIQKLLELERLRVRIASDLHDDVGGSLTKISLQADLIKAGVEPEKINSNLEKISGLSREVIRTMSDIVWAIDSRNDSIGNMIDRMRDFSNGILAGKNIQLHFEVSGLNQEKKINVELRQNIYLILKEAVNNVTKYSEATECRILLNQQNGRFQLSIADNGKGISEPQNKTGHGMKNFQMRAERIDASVEFKTENGFELILERKEI